MISKTKRYILAFCSFTILETLGFATQPEKGVHNNFELGHGVNASHWLAQHFDSLPSKDVFFTEKDVIFLRNEGFDHLRIPIEESEMWNKDGSMNEESFEYLDDAIVWAKNAGMKVILDLHIINSHHFNAENEPNEHKNTLFTSDAAQEHLIDLWMQLSKKYSQEPNDFLAYEILNEAVADNHEDWNKLVAKCIKAIRAKEPNRYLVIGSNRWQQTQYFPYLKVPEGDKNLILSFHFYSPIAFTHYSASWIGEYSNYEGPVNYPGNIVPSDVLEKLPNGKIKEKLKENPYNTKETLHKEMLPAIRYAKEHGLKLYCGEWGCLPTVPREMRLQWYRDMSQIFEEEGIDNAIWSYKTEFGIRSNDGKEKDSKLIKAILTGK